MRYGDGWAYDSTHSHYKRAKPTHTDPEDARTSDPSLLLGSWLSWAGDILHHKPELVIGECTQHFDFQMMQQYFDETYIISQCTYSPKDMGIPVSRSRQYVLGVRKDLVIAEPYTDKIFHQIFARKLMVDGRVFFRAPRSRVAQEMEKAKSKREDLVAVTDREEELRWDEILPGQLRIRLEGYESSARDKKMPFMLVDLNQRPLHAAWELVSSFATPWSCLREGPAV